MTRQPRIQHPLLKDSKFLANRTGLECISRRFRFRFMSTMGSAWSTLQLVPVALNALPPRQGYLA